MMTNQRVPAVFLGLSSLLFACSNPFSMRDVQEQHVRFLHVADLHGQLEEHWEYLPDDPKRFHRMGGMARLKTALEERRRSAPGAVFTADGGDTFQGSALAAWTSGEAVIPSLNALGLDVGVPGNWDVVYGPDVFRKLFGAVRHTIICYNFHDTATDSRLFDPAVVLERKGVRVAFVGLTDPTTSTRQPPAEVRGLDTTRTAGFREFVQALRRTERPHLVVLVDHTGLAPSVQLAHDIPELDIILSGHTHERLYAPIRVGKTLVVEPGSLGSFMGQLDVTLRHGVIVASQFELVHIDAARFDEDTGVAALISEIKAPFRERLTTVLGETKTPLLRYDVLESTTDNLIADAVREATDTDVAFTNGFRFGPPIPSGPITESDLWAMLPLDSRIKRGTVTGSQLQHYLEHEMELVFASDPSALSGGWGPRPSGMTVEFQAGAPKGSRVQQVKTRGEKSLIPTDHYTLGGCEREGEPLDVVCRLADVHEVRYVEGSVHEALRGYIRRHSPLVFLREGRVRATDLPSKVFSQYGILQRLWAMPGDKDAVRQP